MPMTWVQPWPPVVLLAFADSDPNLPLSSLAKERSGIVEKLSRLRDRGRIELEVLPDASVRSIVDTLRDVHFHGRVRAFHFAGHASSEEVMLFGVDGNASPTSAETLAAFLGRQEGLSLVILNGCSTEAQVQHLIAAGVPRVIATSRAIGDDEAAELAIGLYAHLVTDPLGRAFHNALAELELLHPQRFRELELDDGWTATPPWRFHGDPDWRLAPEPYVCTVHRRVGHHAGYVLEIAPHGERWSRVEIGIPGRYPDPPPFYFYLGQGPGRTATMPSPPRLRVDEEGMHALVWGDIGPGTSLCIECQGIPERLSLRSDYGDTHELDLSHQSILHRSVR
jgi:hypothetical protein